MARVDILNGDKLISKKGKLSSWWCDNEPTKGICISVGDGSIYFNRVEARQVLKAITEGILNQRLTDRNN